jgi:acetyl esterase/lipase
VRWRFDAWPVFGGTIGIGVKKEDGMASPELDKLVAMLRSASISGTQTVEEIRAGWERFAAAFPAAADVGSEAQDAGGVPSEWVSTPNVDRERIILYLHGGGYNIGTLASYRNFTGNLARATRARLLVAGYRLAPENPFPAAVDDALASYRWLLAQGISPDRIIVMGDSAGGGLAVATVVALRDAGDPLPASIVAICPSTDLAKEGASNRERAHLDPIGNYESSMAHALRYVGDKANLKHPLASPLYADLHGLPPMLILGATHDTLFDDSTRLAAKAEAAGVEVEFDVWDEMIHVWPLFADILPEGRDAIEKIGRYVDARLS